MPEKQRKCPHCSELHPAEAVFCPSTGRSIPPEKKPGCFPKIVIASALLLGLGLIAFGGWYVFMGNPSGDGLSFLTADATETTPISSESNAVDQSARDGQTPVPTATALPSATEAAPTATPTPEPTPTPIPSLTTQPTLAPAFIWNSDVVQRSQAVGYFTSMAVDPQGFLHVGYYQDNSDIIWYAHNESGQWQFDYVVGGLETGFNLSFELDTAGQPHFAYKMRGNNQSPEVRYVFWNGAAWQLFRVFGSYAANAEVSLELNQQNQPHIAYKDGYTWNVKYIYYTPQSGWIIDTVDASNPEAFSVPLVLDNGGAPHLAYQGQSGGLIYSTKPGDSWSREVVDESVGAGFHVALVLDSLGQPHIAYYDNESAVLKYAHRVNDQWVISLVDDTGRVGQYPSIQVDTLGQIHISYYDMSNSALKFAHGRNGTWNIYTVDNTGNVGQWTSLVLRAGLPYISYLDQDNEDLRLAWAILTNP